MATLTVTAKGQVTFRKDLLQHLGVRPGDKLEVDKMPNGRMEVRAARTGKIEDLFGILNGHTKKTATLEEIEKAIQDGWAGKR